jgi:hypothetical protein
MQLTRRAAVEIAPRATCAEVARRMRDAGVGSLMVCESVAETIRKEL